MTTENTNVETEVKDAANTQTDAKAEALLKAEALKTAITDAVTAPNGATLDEIVVSAQATQKAIKPVLAGLVEDGIIGFAKGITRATDKGDGKVGKAQPVYIDIARVNTFLTFPELPQVVTQKLGSILKVRPAINQRETESRLKKEHLNGVASATQHVFRIGVYDDKTAVILDGNSRIAAYKAGNLFFENDDETPVILEIYKLRDVEHEKELYHEFDSTFSVMSSRDLDFQAKAELDTSAAPTSKTMNKSIKSAVSYATGKAVKVGVGIYDDVKDEIFFLDGILKNYEPEKAIDGAILSAMLKLTKEKGIEDPMEDFIGDVLLSLTEGQGVLVKPEATLAAVLRVNTNRTYGSARATTIFDAMVEDFEAR